MRVVRPLACAAALVLGAVTNVPAAFAAVPGNDTVAGATPVSTGFDQVLDTTEATTDADDAQLNDSCGAPATDASVWYTVTLPDTAGVVVDVSQSDYSAGVLVGEGTPGDLQTVACGPGTVGFVASAGTTYYVLAIDDQEDGSGNGGSLHISFGEAPPPPSLDVTVAPRGTFDKATGGAILHGSYTCSDADFIEVYGEASQSVGRIATIRGYFDLFDVGTCDGLSHPWSAEAVPDSGKFKGGKTLTVTFSYACGPFDCADGYTEQTVRLSGK